ncbi:MAG: molybdopterin-dependent oxidoreductase [Hyphomicrobiaceae bacterium]|nr:MAG: molybdopterin-dependent oxidoreductase [Hyphomicrobiaceae bacterium]
MVMSATGLNSIGKETWRKDGIAKVTGAEQYTPDISVGRMWYGRVLRSCFAHANIRKIDTSAAEAMGAVCLTFADIPKIKYNERIVSTPPCLYKDRYVLADKARHVGEAIAAVAAPTEALAEKALRAIKIDYEPLQTITTMEQALRDGAAPIHDTIRLLDKDVPIRNNVAATRIIEVGDIDKGFAEADFAIERTYRTNRIYHAQMETKTVLCRPEADGGITVWATTQSIHNTRILLGEIYGIPLNKLNVKKSALGGSFGSSIQMNSVIPICVGLALKSDRPVKIVSTREEDMYDHVRYPAQITLKLGLKKDGTPVAGHMRAEIDIGAHNIQAYPFLGGLGGFWASLYKLPNMKYEGRAIYSNKTPSCAMQGFGSPQCTFAVESLMDEIAHELGRDPVEYKLKHYVGLGGTFWGQGPASKCIIRSDGVPELLEVGSRKIGWDSRPVPGSQTGRYRRGIGMARGFHTSGVGHAKASGAEMIDYSGAIVKVNEDGSVDYIQSLMDHGGGTSHAIAKIVAEEIGVPARMVGISPVDTSTTLYDVTTHATRGIYAGGAAAHRAAKKVKERLLEHAAKILDVLPESLVIEPDEELGQGVIHCPNLQERRMTVGQVAKYLHLNSLGTIAAAESMRQVNCPPAYVAYFVEVEVDTDTGHIATKRAVLGSDCGTVVNPKLASGQLVGGFSKGQGYALFEDNHWDGETGELASRGFWIDSKTPSVSETPLVADVETYFAHTYEPTGPFGAKGLGEAAKNPAIAAFAAAVYNAIGVRFYEVPITPEKVLAALASRGEPGAGPKQKSQAAELVPACK